MIEVEKKFVATPETEKALVEGAEFLREAIFTDSYFDDKDFSLTTHDIWFRDREGRYEVKLPLNQDIRARPFDQYHELETEEEIAAHFAWDLSQKNFGEWVKASGYAPVATYTTTRRKYKKEGFAIDIDTTDFGFNIIEIELMVENEKHVGDAIRRILAFATSHDIPPPTYVRGKLPEYLKLNNPTHLQKLIDAGVVKEV